jgi:hypothetical protein
MLVHGLAEVAIVGNPVEGQTMAILDELRKPYRPNVIVALAREDVEGEDDTIPLLSYRMRRNNQPTVYVCRNFACQFPVNTIEGVREQLKEASPA